MFSLSQRSQKLKPSPTLALNALAKELASQGRDIISLAVGELDFDTFPHIKDAAKNSLDQGFTKYVPADGIAELKSAVIARTERLLGLKYEIKQCMITPGGKQAVFNLLQVLCNPGDEVIVPAPYWVSYPAMIELADAKCVLPYCGEESSFKMTPKILESALTNRTKVLILTSPNNPTGQVYTRKELEALVRVLEGTDVWVISDDIYDQIVFNGDSVAPHVAQLSERLRPKVFLANSMSKTYAMTGWRVGSVIGDGKVIKACSDYQSQVSGCGVSFSQKGAVAALTGPQEEVLRVRSVLKERRDLAVERISKIKSLELVTPDGAFYLFPSIRKTIGKSFKGSKLASCSGLSKMLLEHEGVAVVPGEEFGAPGYLRLSYSLEKEKLREGLDRIDRFLNALV